MSDSLADYYSQYGVDVNALGDRGLGEVTGIAANNYAAKQKADYAALPTYTPAGAWQQSPRGSYWTDGSKFIVPTTASMAQQGDLLQLQGTGAQWSQPNNGGVWAAYGQNPQAYQFSGDLPGYKGQTPTGYQVFDQAPTEKFFRDAPEESFWSTLNGGSGDQASAFGGKPWWGGSPLAAFAGAAGAIAAAGGAAGGATSSIGGTEGASALGGSATAGGGSALSFSDLLPQWMQNAGSNATSTGSSWMDSLKNFLSSNGTDASWGVNPTTGASNMDWEEELANLLGGGNGVADIPSGSGGVPDWGSLDSGPAATSVDPASAKMYLDANSPGMWDKIMKAVGNNPTSAAKIAGQLLATGLGVLGANRQAGALTGLSNQYANMGAPYRAMLASSYADPNAFLANDPGIQASVNQGTSALARALSTKGNPTGSGAAMQEMQNYATQGLYGQLGNERNRLANFGGLSNFNAAAPGLAGQSIQAQGGALNAIGSGISAITNPPNTLEQALNALNGLSGLKLNNGTGL